MAQQQAVGFIRGRTADRIGLVAFAGEALTQVPVTLDYAVVEQAVMDLKIGSLEDGTAIGSGLATAVNRLRRAPDKSKVILLLTDGENNKGLIDPRTAAATAAAYGIKVYTIGVGTIGEAPIPTGRGLGGFRYEMLPVRIDEPLLREIAAEDRRPILPRARQRGAEPHLPSDRSAREDPDPGHPVHQVRGSDAAAAAARPRRARARAAARQHPGGAGAMIFDAPAAPLPRAVARAGARLRRLARAAAAHPAGAPLVPELGRLARAPRAAGPRSCSALVGAAGDRGARGPALRPAEIKTETRALSLVFAVDISRSMLAEDVAARTACSARCARPAG